MLVLEDDDGLRMALAETLSDEGYAVSAAESSAAALDMARAQEFDLLVTDVRMRGLDGIDCLAAVTQLQPAIRCLVITGYASPDAPARAMAAGAADYLYKPFSMDDLLTAVDRLRDLTREDESYTCLLGSLLAGYRRLKESATLVLRKGTVEKSRHQLFQAFFVGVRSGQLKPRAALGVWIRLELLELKRQASADLQELARDYQALRAELSAAANPAEALERPFTDLYTRVLEGRVTLSQLKLAPLLRSLDPQVLSRSSELGALYEQIWGPA